MKQYQLSDYQFIYAYGNSEEDLEMLSIADYPYMVGEEKALPKLKPQALKIWQNMSEI